MELAIYRQNVRLAKRYIVRLGFSSPMGYLEACADGRETAMGGHEAGERDV